MQSIFAETDITGVARKNANGAELSNMRWSRDHDLLYIDGRRNISLILKSNS